MPISKPVQPSNTCEISFQGQCTSNELPFDLIKIFHDKDPDSASISSADKNIDPQSQPLSL